MGKREYKIVLARVIWVCKGFKELRNVSQYANFNACVYCSVKSIIAFVRFSEVADSEKVKNYWSGALALKCWNLTQYVPYITFTIQYQYKQILVWTVYIFYFIKKCPRTLKNVILLYLSW